MYVAVSFGLPAAPDKALIWLCVIGKSMLGPAHRLFSIFIFRGHSCKWCMSPCRSVSLPRPIKRWYDFVSSGNQCSDQLTVCFPFFSFVFEVVSVICRRVVCSPCRARLSVDMTLCHREIIARTISPSVFDSFLSCCCFVNMNRCCCFGCRCMAGNSRDA